MTKARLTRWMTPLILAASLNAQPFPDAQQAPPDKIDLPDKGIDVPMLDVGGRPMLELQLNGKGPYRFILDTGASFSVIDGALAKELALPSENAGPVRIGRVEIGGAFLTGLTAMRMPSMFGGGGAPRGVLSALSFPGYLLFLDYPRKRIAIRPGELPAPDSRTVFQYPSSRNLPGVPVRVAGREIVVDLDSGSPMGLVLPTKYLKEIPLASSPKEIGRARTHGGEFPISSAPVEGAVELGQFQLDPSDVHFSDVRPGNEPPEGNLGASILHRFQVTLDSKNRRVRFETPGAN